MSNNVQATEDVKDDTEAPDQVQFIVMKNPYVIIIGICDYDAPNHALPAVQDDIRKMNTLWKTKFKYPNVSICGLDTNKITATELGSFLNDESSRIQLEKQVDGLIIIYSGHGANDGFGENYIVGSNNDRLALTTIQEKFDCEKCDYLKGKPKILYFDCCRGEEKIQDEQIKQRAKGNAAKKQYVNNLSDFMMHYATSQNYISWSNQDKGGHLINAVFKCYSLDYERHKVCAVTLHETSMKLNEMVSISNKGKQTAEIVNRLCYDVYVKPFEGLGVRNDVVASRGTLLKMLSEATKQAKDYPALKSKYTEQSQSFKNLQKKEIEYKKQIQQLKQNQTKLNNKITNIQSKLNENYENNLNFEHEINTLHQRNTQLQQQVDTLTQQKNELEHEQKVQLPGLPPIPEPQPISPENSLLQQVNTWQHKPVTDWSCQELQSWIRSVGLPHNEIADLLVAINRTKTNGQQFSSLHNAQAIHDRFIEEGFEIEENVAVHVADNLPRVHTPTSVHSENENENESPPPPPPTYSRNDNVFESDKLMEEWDCDELQEWIRSLNIAEGHKELVVHSIIEMECTGSDLASCKSAQEVLDSFDEINENVANVIFNGIRQMKGAYF